MYIDTSIYGGLGVTFGWLTGIINTAPSSFTQPKEYAVIPDYNYVWAIPEAVQDFICTCLNPIEFAQYIISKPKPLGQQDSLGPKPALPAVE